MLDRERQDLFFALISSEEGFRSTIYRCPTGHPTIGYGVNLEITPIPRHIAELWTRHIIRSIHGTLQKRIPFYDDLDPARQAVLVSLAYQLGVGGLLRFRRMLAAVSSQDYASAARELADSRLASQTPERVRRHQEILLRGSVQMGKSRPDAEP